MLKTSLDVKTKCRKYQKNALGLLPGAVEGTCPFATEGPGGCFEKRGKTRVCYAYRLANIRPNVNKVLKSNTDLLMGTDVDGMVRLLDDEFSRFEKQEIDKGSPKSHRIYRLHWSGDIFSRDYAKALTTAISKYPGIQFWTYTRSWEYLNDDMYKLKNLSLYISLDADNIDTGLIWHKETAKRVSAMGDEYVVPKVSYMGVDIPGKLKKYAEEGGYNLSQCPTDTGEITQEYACHMCGGCVKGNRDIVCFETR